MSNSLQPHGHTHSSLFPRVCSNSCPLSQWCYLPISSSFAPSPLALNLSQHQCVFQWVSFAHQVAKVLKLQFNISTSSDIQCLFPIWWVGLIFSVQGTLEFLQHHNSKASVLCSAFFMVQLSYPYMTTGKARALIICTSISKVLSLLYNMLCMFA